MIAPKLVNTKAEFSKRYSFRKESLTTVGKIELFLPFKPRQISRWRCKDINVRMNFEFLLALIVLILRYSNYYKTNINISK